MWAREKLACIDCVTDALTKKRIRFFAEMGCRPSDHGLDYVPYTVKATKDGVNAIYQRKVMRAKLHRGKS